MDLRQVNQIHPTTEKTISVQDICDFLNEFARRDRDAVENLFERLVPLNQAATDLLMTPNPFDMKFIGVAAAMRGVLNKFLECTPYCIKLNEDGCYCVELDYRAEYTHINPKDKLD